MITVAIIEDNRLVREGMTDMLNELPDVKVVLAATSLEAAILTPPKSPISQPPSGVS
jgi:DNA-binding NarL/FixJ family response regulator